MFSVRIVPGPSKAASRVRNVGILVIVVTVASLALGLFLVGTLASDVRSWIQVSRSAVSAIDATIVLVDGVTEETKAGLEQASGSVGSASTILDETAAALEILATSLDEQVPEELETLRAALPGAIQAADAVDTALGALSLIGIDYDPEKALAPTLREIDTALAALPAELRAQSETLRALTPHAIDLRGETERLSGALVGLAEGLDGFAELTASHHDTLLGARTAIDRTDTSLMTHTWLLRLLIVLGGLTGVATGWALIIVSRAMAGTVSSYQDSSGEAGES